MAKKVPINGCVCGRSDVTGTFFDASMLDFECVSLVALFAVGVSVPLVSGYPLISSNKLDTTLTKSQMLPALI